MTVATRVMLKVQSLPEEQQQKVLEFIDQLPHVPLPSQAPLIDLYGMLAGYDTTEEEIAEARREM